MRGLRYLPLAVVAALIWFFFLSDMGSDWLARRSARGERDASVGRIVEVGGAYSVQRQGRTEEFAKDSGAQDLFEGDVVSTSGDAKLLIVLESQDEIEIPARAVVSFQRWNATEKNSPLYLQVIAGDVILKKQGVRGRAYVNIDGKLYFPGQKPSNQALSLNVTRQAGLALAPNESGGGDFESGEDSSDEDSPETTELATTGSEPQTLSNEYIDEMIVSRQGQLQKCWVSRLKDRPDLRGRMTLQFLINRRGKVRDVRVVDSSINDEPLQRCVISVIERIPFRPFRGAEISLSYPISFE